MTVEYNKAMKNILPKHGIETVEIPRAEESTLDVYSATKVRKLIQNGKYDKLKLILPSTSLEYLCRVNK